MSCKIGPKELYVPRPRTLGPLEFDNTIKQDNESAVVWYKNNYLDAPNIRQRLIDSYLATINEVDRIDNCMDGHSAQVNFLLFSAANKNVTLVKFIVDHIDDEKTLNLLDPTFIQTAVTYAVMIRAKKTNTPTADYKTICDKSYACTQKLLEGGANPNVFFSYPMLMEDQFFSAQKLIPSVAASVLINWTAMIEANKNNLVDINYKNNCLTYTHYLEKMFLLFFQHEASITLCQQDAIHNAEPTKRLTIPGRQIHAQSEVVESDTPYLKEIVPKCVALIKHTQVNAYWEQYRLFFLASKSPASLIATIPKDINSLITNCLFDL